MAKRSVIEARKAQALEAMAADQAAISKKVAAQTKKQNAIEKKVDLLLELVDPKGTGRAALEKPKKEKAKPEPEPEAENEPEKEAE